MEDLNPGKPKARRKNQKVSEEDLDDDLLPESGLLTPEGHIFYHCTVLSLTTAQYKRAEEHGINLRTNKAFTIEESVKVFENWKQFAENNNLKLEKAMEYITAKKSEKHIIQHQREHDFWPKLCHGLPHRHGKTIKDRAAKMLSDDFLKTFDWDGDLFEQIKNKYFKIELWDDLTKHKAQKLIEKGYSSTHLGEILELPVGKAEGLTWRIRKLQRRDDSVMISNFYETAVSLGLDPEKLRRRVISGKEYKLLKLEKLVQIDELAFKMHLSEQRCKELFKTILRNIMKKFEESKGNGMEEDEAWEEAMGVISPNPRISTSQIIKALEVICQNIGKKETSHELSKNMKIAKLLKNEGVTDFRCHLPEFSFLHDFIFFRLMKELREQLFANLRKNFSTKFHLHCFLWAMKRQEVWEKLSVGKDTTRYEVVIQHESSNPLASKMTMKFLKTPKTMEWIMEPRRSFNRPRVERLELAVESFVLYLHRKFNGQFKFPAKLRPLLTGPSVSKIVRRLSRGEEENSEYLSLKEAKKVVEEETESKIEVKLKFKNVAVRNNVEDSDSDSDECLKGLFEKARLLKERRIEKRETLIEEMLEKASTTLKIKKRMKSLEDREEIVLQDEIHRQKRVFDKAAQKKICSKEFIEDSEDSDEEVMAPEVKDDENSDSELSEAAERQGDDSEASDDATSSGEILETSETPSSGNFDVDTSVISKNAAPEDSEDPESKPRGKKRKRQDPEDNILDVTSSETSSDSKGAPENVTSSESKKRRHDELDDVTITQFVKKSKRKAPEDVEDEELDVTSFESTKKSKKSEKQRHDAPEDVTSSESTSKPEKQKKGGHNESDDVTTSDSVKKSKKARRKVPEDEELDVTSSEVSKKSKKEAPEDVTSSEPFVKLKTRRHDASEDVDPSEQRPEDSESENFYVTSSEDLPKKRKKTKKHKSKM